ncbi:hypothetical protein GTZ99_13435 [Novosphingobium sp. FSY-8]|uniref:Uncharacterized protein n=1 Tax=Novosphingobium ovatum TaxID=1908523 RepID=A0ABW9XG72_9SPHN|nr:hypothetical protein [Novosphingobium ovatum]NBC37552.1 hypothetical protein [Novosphingobium ovatum]
MDHTAAPRRRRRVPTFTPVPTRARADGWTPARQAGFIAALHITGRVDKAAAAVGLSRQSAYRLRERADADSFAAAWDAILYNHGQPLPRKVTQTELFQRVQNGVLRPVVHAGRHCLTLCLQDNKALMMLIRHFARAGAGAPDERLG